MQDAKPQSATKKKSLGKIALKKGLASSAPRDLKTVGATILV